MSNNMFNTSSIHQKGQREYNEDSIFPNDEIESTNTNLFLVCDGVGGHARGEMASDLICTQMDVYFTANKVEVSNQDVIDAAVKFVETKFDSYIVNNPDVAGMASTLTLLHLHKQGATVAHIGDSRVYQFRNGKILFRTEDHSLVQELFKCGELKSEEEMAQHPRRNEITRAVQGASIRKTKADVTVITDVKAGDIFLLCTDGILESFSDKKLEAVFSENESIDTIAATITMRCKETSKDNFSAYLVEINEEYADMLSANIATAQQTNVSGNQYATEKAEADIISTRIEDSPQSKGEQPQAEERNRTVLDLPSNQSEGSQPLKKAEVNVSEAEEPVVTREVKEDEYKAFTAAYEKGSEANSKSSRLMAIVIGVVFALIVAMAALWYLKTPTKKQIPAQKSRVGSAVSSGSNRSSDALKEPSRNSNKLLNDSQKPSKDSETR